MKTAPAVLFGTFATGAKKNKIIWFLSQFSQETQVRTYGEGRAETMNFPEELQAWGQSAQSPSSLVVALLRQQTSPVQDLAHDSLDGLFVK